MPNRESVGTPSKRFRIAFSFAGEKREFVSKVARLLADRFGDDQILYDKFHEAEFARGNLALYLPPLYHDQSDLIVGVLCADYETKEWCGLEYNALFDLFKKRRFEGVMLARFGRVEAAGLFSLPGYLDLDYKTPDEAAASILERLALNEGKPKDHYLKPVVASGATRRIAIPHNLPSLQPFFGREQELHKIADALDPESRTWGALVDGPGGMGKTSLAVRAAYDAPAGAFERIVFISLKSRELDDDGVRDLSGFLISGLAELFNELARELGHSDIPQKPADQRPRLLLDALRGTRTLLVLDNLESLLKHERDTVFTFVKKLPAGCKAILTSRLRIGSGAEELILERISEEAALATLARLAESNPALAKVTEADRRVLDRETTGKPLLLRWTAGQIGRGSCVTFRDAIAYLRSCPTGNDPLEFIFGDLVEDFSEVETRALCALSCFTLPAKVEHVAIVAGCPEAETERALRSLINRSLVVPSEELKTFTLVPLVADFLRVKKPEVLRETGDRVASHAYALVVQNGGERYDRFPVLEADWPTVAAALPRFLAGENDQLQEVCTALDWFLKHSGRWDELFTISREAEVKAAMNHELLTAGWCAQSLASIHFARGQAPELFACVERMEAYWRGDAGGSRERRAALRMRGNGHALIKDYPAAIAAFREILDMSLAADDQEGVADSLSCLAAAEFESGDFDASERHYQESLQISRAVSDMQNIATCLINLAGAALNRENWSGAEALGREALPWIEKLGRVDLIATNSLFLAQALMQQGKNEEAVVLARQAVEICRKLGLPDLAPAYQLLAECEGRQARS